MISFQHFISINILKLSYLNKELLPYSTSEMIVLIKYFGCMIGQFIESQCAVWNYYKILRSIVNMLLLKSVSEADVKYLECLISEHHSLYIDLFSKRFNYPAVILETGPVSHNWCMRFERKNIDAKILTQLIRCRINLCKSLATRLKFQLQVVYIKLTL